MTTDDTRFVELYILHVLQIACHLSGATRGLASRTYHSNGSRAGTYPQMTRDLLNHIYTCTANRVPLGQVLPRRSALSDIASDWSSNRRIIRMVVRTGTSHPMTRDLLNYIYYMYCKSRATSPEQVSKWTSKRTHPDQKVAKLRYQHLSYR